ncbi:MAG TPA: (E)-4-hydroxy-3-methylbut-2-enyl-diphosphate synthase [Bacteroidales bacterium]|nr:(E)-4-hydroxy-3-methylbut-2-enyl-diphosphate synthase [Bacteroidales bacterium]
MSDKTIVNIGNIRLGGALPVVVQTMTNTATTDIEGTIEQTIRVIDKGAEMVRITVPTLKEIDSLKEIVTKIREKGYKTPIIADVHYLPEVAESVATFVDKVRINPGNFVDKREFKSIDLTDEEYDESVAKMALKAKSLIDVCKEHHTAIRIGVNQGSLCDRIVSRYGNTPLAMVQSALEWIQICQQYDFQNIVFSLKSSNVNTMLEATSLLAQKMDEQGTRYPLHLGVTEAADGMEGRVKSAIGIGALLLQNIGNTIRVSLTEDPENEVIFAKKLIQVVARFEPHKYSIQNQKLTIVSDETDPETWWAEASAVAGYFHLNRQYTKLQIINPNFRSEQCIELEDTILQGCRIKLTKTEIIACPSCGRTQYDIQKVLGMVKEKFSHYPNLKIGVMGCVVNGPGEMADADIGIIGSANGKMAVYKGTQRISPFLPYKEAFDILEEQIHTIIHLKNQVR